MGIFGVYNDPFLIITITSEHAVLLIFMISAPYFAQISPFETTEPFMATGLGLQFKFGVRKSCGVSRKPIPPWNDSNCKHFWHPAFIFNRKHHSCRSNAYPREPCHDDILALLTTTPLAPGSNITPRADDYFMMIALVIACIRLCRSTPGHVQWRILSLMPEANTDCRLACSYIATSFIIVT